jgi:hypothetical protein
MWVYQGPSCPDRPFSAELDGTEVNTQIRGVLAHGADLNSGSSPVPIRDGVNSPWVSLLDLTFVCLCQFLFFQHICILRQDLGYAHSALRGVTLPEDAVRQEANHANNEHQQARRQRRPVQSAARAATRAGGRKLPPSLNLQEMAMRRRKTMKRGR